jgi:hypothetical protein
MDAGPGAGHGLVQHARAVTVQTNTLDHPAALPLYQRMGFEPVSQNQAIIRPLSDDEILAMAKIGITKSPG